MPDRQTLSRWARRSIELPPHVVARRALGKVADAGTRRASRRRDMHVSTYAPSPGRLATYWATLPIDSVVTAVPALAWLTSNYVDQRFDVLGSGWVTVRYGVRSAGLEGLRYPPSTPVEPDPAGRWLEGRLVPGALPRAQAIWRLAHRDYVPIDWQLDVKTGWRWSERTWYRDVSYGGDSGVDVKVPWELGRLQHLPQLALAAAAARADVEGLEHAERYEREFRNQVLDFVATNPPRFGVNWVLAMDAGIRVANIVVARDLFLASGTRFDQEFEDVLAASVLDHGRHVVANLEWSEEVRANHYLADVVGLLFAAAYLPRSPEVDAWLAFAVRELLEEVALQFWPDGSNFEASVCYHRLSAEMVAWSVALLLALPDDRLAALEEHPAARFDPAVPMGAEPLPVFTMPDGSRRPLPPWIGNRLARMAAFTRDATKPSGRVAQIGDNDSGRFLKLAPPVVELSAVDARQRFVNLDRVEEMPPGGRYWLEESLDHRDLRDVIAALLRPGASVGVEGSLVRALTTGRTLLVDPDLADAAGQVRVATDQIFEELARVRDALPSPQRRVVRIAIPGGSVADGLSTRAYPDFGLWILRSRRVWLAVHCGPIGQNGLGGHAHHDQLAIELSVDGEDWLRDPGTYVYTPLPDRRNEYRSSKAHAGPRLLGAAVGPLGDKLFSLRGSAEGRCLAFGPQGFAGVLALQRGRRIWGMVQLTDAAVIVSHWAEGCELVPPHGDITDWRVLAPSVPFSPGYGIVERR